MTKEEFAARMAKIANDEGWNKEYAHIKADHLIIELLKSLGYNEGAQIFNDMPKWYA